MRREGSYSLVRALESDQPIFEVLRFRALHDSTVLHQLPGMVASTGTLLCGQLFSPGAPRGIVLGNAHQAAEACCLTRLHALNECASEHAQAELGASQAQELRAGAWAPCQGLISPSGRPPQPLALPTTAMLCQVTRQALLAWQPPRRHPPSADPLETLRWTPALQNITTLMCQHYGVL